MSFKKIDAKSAEAISSALDIFSVPETNISAQNAAFVEYLPNNPVKESPIHFTCSSGPSFYDLHRSYLLTEFELKVKAGDQAWRNVQASDKCSVINGLGATFMQNLRISLNGQEIYHSNALQSYKAYWDLLLNFPYHSTSTHLSEVGWYDSKKFDDPTDAGFVNRRANFLDGSEEYITRIFADVFQQPQYLLNHCTLDIEITPHRDSFCIEDCADPQTMQFKLELKKCKLYMKTVNLTDGVGIGIAATLTKTPAIYPLKRTNMKSQFISAGRREYVTTLYSSEVPRRIVLGLVQHAAAQDTSKDNPFNFIHANVNSVAISSGGQNYPNVPYTLQYPRQYVRAYHDCMDALNYSFTNGANTISKQMYKQGFALYVFNLGPTLDDTESLEVLKKGPSVLKISFDSPVPAGGYSLIALSEYDSLLIIDQNRQISTDLTP